MVYKYVAVYLYNPVFNVDWTSCHICVGSSPKTTLIFHWIKSEWMSLACTKAMKFRPSKSIAQKPSPQNHQTACAPPDHDRWLLGLEFDTASWGEVFPIVILAIPDVDGSQRVGFFKTSWLFSFKVWNLTGTNWIVCTCIEVHCFFYIYPPLNYYNQNVDCIYHIVYRSIVPIIFQKSHLGDDFGN